MTTQHYALAFVATALVAACTDDDDPTIVIDPIADIVDEGRTRGDALAQLGGDELAGNSFEVVIGMTATILDAINESRIQEAVFASNVVFGDDTFDLAEEILADHQLATTQLDDVVRFYGVPLIPSATANAVLADSAAELSTMRATDPASLDFVYLQGQVVRNAESLVLLDELAVIVGPGEMADYIASTRAVIDANLAQAIDLLDDFY